MNIHLLRKRVFEICYENDNPHLASSLSCLDIIRSIYTYFDFANDIFILSKGHGCAALFAVLECFGYEPDVSQRHPNMDLDNGVSCTTGSLGHGLPIALGMALGKKILGQKGEVSVLLGDNEFYEGTTNESLYLRDKFQLYNLSVHVDHNEGIAISTGFNVYMHYNEKEYPHVHRLTEEEYEKAVM